MSVTIEATIQCEFYWEAWGPHPGCKEFMQEPEAIIQCADPAAYVVVGEQHGPDGVQEVRIPTCGHHLKDIAEDCLYWRTLRVEPLL